MENDYENSNVLDFVAYKLRVLIETLAKTGRKDYANAMQEALDLYLLNEVDIVFVKGWPRIVEDVDKLKL
jgi:hypothetical protein